MENATGVEKSKFAKDAYPASLNSEVDQLDISKLETTPVYLSKISDVVNNEVVKKTVYDEFVKKKLILLRILILLV